jgi:hypothetical protein
MATTVDVARQPQTSAGIDIVSAPYIIAEPPANEHMIVTAVKTVISLLTL